MTTYGICYVAVGQAAKDLAAKAALALGDTPIAYAPLGLPTPVTNWNNIQLSRWLKITLLSWTPFDCSLYMDADTRVGNLPALLTGFDLLDSGFDMALAPSRNQAGQDWLWHIGSNEQAITLEELNAKLLQWQCGVLFVKRNERTIALFDCWQTEWLRYQNQDQAAFMRAIRQQPVKIAVLGQPWNGGAIVQHDWGALR